MSIDAAILIRLLINETSQLLASIIAASQQRPDLNDYKLYAEDALVQGLLGAGLSRGVVAQMFGVSQRTLFRHRNRAKEHVDGIPQAIWDEVLDFIIEQDEPVTHDALREQFIQAGLPGEDIQAKRLQETLDELVRCKRLFQSGGGVGAAYIPNAEYQDQRHLVARHHVLKHMAWLVIYTEGPLSPEDFMEHFLHERIGQVRAVLAELEAEGHVTRQDGLLRSEQWLMNQEETIAWSVAVLDHFQTMARSIRTRLAMRERFPQMSPDLVGGSTYVFDLWEGHPLAPELLRLLSRYRGELGALWEQAEELQAAHRDDPLIEKRYRLAFYLGQSIKPQDKELAKDLCAPKAPPGRP